MRRDVRGTAATRGNGRATLLGIACFAGLVGAAPAVVGAGGAPLQEVDAPRAASSEWTIFRGDQGLTGIAEGTLPT